MLRQYEIVVSVEKCGGIGNKNQIPWNLRGDMRNFRNLTTRNDYGKKCCIIIGRKTFESIEEKYRPIPDRVNIIISRTMEIVNDEDYFIVRSLKEALQLAANDKYNEVISNVFIVGGESIFNDAMRNYIHLCKKIHVTHVDENFACDRYFTNDLSNDFIKRNESSWKQETDGGLQIKYKFATYDKRNHEEGAYLDLISKVLLQGNERNERTGVGTYSIFGNCMKFDLRDGIIPLLTTKKVYWRSVVEELLWFISGSTDNSVLRKKGINIWNLNGSRETLDKLGLKNRREDDLGPIYGFQWRHFGAKYIDCDTDYTGQGIDQLVSLIEKINRNPSDRRLVISAWNVSDLKFMALPPCHMMMQFYVDDGELSCSMYQRSCDIGLGVPFNIASYSILTRMIAHVCGLKPGIFIYFMGDVHIYKNHREKLLEQVSRTANNFPTLIINNNHCDMDKFEFADFKLLDYNPCSPIKMDMAN